MLSKILQNPLKIICQGVLFSKDVGQGLQLHQERTAVQIFSIENTEDLYTTAFYIYHVYNYFRTFYSWLQIVMTFSTFCKSAIYAQRSREVLYSFSFKNICQVSAAEVVHQVRYRTDILKILKISSKTLVVESTFRKTAG